MRRTACVSCVRVCVCACGLQRRSDCGPAAVLPGTLLWCVSWLVGPQVAGVWHGLRLLQVGACVFEREGGSGEVGTLSRAEGMDVVAMWLGALGRWDVVGVGSLAVTAVPSPYKTAAMLPTAHVHPKHSSHSGNHPETVYLCWDQVFVVNPRRCAVASACGGLVVCAVALCHVGAWSGCLSLACWPPSGPSTSTSLPTSLAPA